MEPEQEVGRAGRDVVEHGGVGRGVVAGVAGAVASAGCAASPVTAEPVVGVVSHSSVAGGPTPVSLGQT